MNQHARQSLYTMFALIFIAFFFSPRVLCAQSSNLAGKALSDQELSDITAQAGISINFDLTMDYSVETLGWGDRDGHGTSTDPGWMGLTNLTIDNLHIWPRTDYVMAGSVGAGNGGWEDLRFLTIDVATISDPETTGDPGELDGLDHATQIVIGIPTITLTMDKFQSEWMLGPDENSGRHIGGVIQGSYTESMVSWDYASNTTYTTSGAKRIYNPDFNQNMGTFEMEDFNLYTGEDGYLLIGAHGTDSTTFPGFTGSGVSISAHDTKVHVDISSWKYTDTDTGDALELQDISIGDGAGGYFSFDTPTDTPIMFDVGTDSSGWAVVQAILSHHTQPRTYSADKVIFCDQDIGSIVIDSLREGPAQLLLAAHQDGSTGMDFEYNTTLDIDEIAYTYNTIPEALVASGIHAAAQAIGSPEDPTAWIFLGMFQIGDLDGVEIDVDDNPLNADVPNPAMVDVGTDPTSGNTTLALELPMQGTLRVEGVDFGGTDFGPCAIDGITVHKLNVTLSPN